MQPFIKWAGGKRQLIPTIKSKMPKDFDVFYEPFLGGGAVLLELIPRKAVVGDINEVLINTYIAIKNESSVLKEQLIYLTNSHNSSIDKKEFYYKMRDTFNDKLLSNNTDIEAVALFIYLNKTCFNGLFRVNSRGLFNVPFNGKEKINLFDEDNLFAISKYLEKIDIINGDFEETCKNAKKGDFVFFDSPYAPIKEDSFESYTKEGFSLDNHIRLAKLYEKLTERGVYCMLTNHNTDLIRELYSKYNIEVVQVKRMINSDANKRSGEEVIITNY